MADNTLKINAKNVAKYVLLPGIIPRAKEFGSEGFGLLAYLIASVFQAVRIFPAGHRFLAPANIGTFGIRQVLAAAANNIEFNRRNIDQIVLFGAVILAMVLMVLQCALLLLALFSGSAFAGGGTVSWSSMFETQFPEVDIAFLMLDYVFGLPTMAAGGGGTATFFGSNALIATGGPTPFHQGMHALFNFYNLALLLVGVLIFMYYVIVVVIETAQTGVPFGRRFSKLYAPFRLVMAIGLLVPFGFGFNAAQYITLYAAKLGSSFATNGWILFNSTLTNPLGADNKALVARPRFPPSDELLYFSSVYHACREMYEIWVPKSKSYLAPTKGVCISSYVIRNGKAEEFVPNPTSGLCESSSGGGTAEYTYADAKKDFPRGDIEIVLGELDENEHKQFAGGVRPYCGKLTVSLGHDNPTIWSYVAGGGATAGDGTPGDQDGQAGVRAVESIYFDMVKELLRLPEQDGGGSVMDVIPGNNPFAAYGERAAHALVPTCFGAANGCSRDKCFNVGLLGDSTTCGKPNWNPTSTVFQDAINKSRAMRDEKINNSYLEFRNGLNLKIQADLERRGWGGAGIWYNYIADINGAYTGAIYAAPSVRQWPEVMEDVKSQRLSQDKGVPACDVFEPNLADAQPVTFNNNTDPDLAKVMNAAYKYFNCEKPNQDPVSATGGATPTDGGCGKNVTTYSYGAVAKGVTANVFIDFISVVFGLNGLFDIRSCSEIDPSTGQSLVHPLAQLSTIGKSLVENAIRSMAMAMGAAFGGGMLGMLSSAFGAAAQSASGMFVGVATIGLTAGFVLYYILPFLPFIYFFFAVGSWVKSIFEAMVGAPLWALAHLRIDGEGLPGNYAVSGYFLIFEIFLRPIVTVFGLIGGMAVFGAMAAVLNVIFDLVTINVTGAPPEGSTSTITVSAIESFRRSVIDQFFFTIMYAVLLYMMATSSFKMIDSVPKYVMRWINSRVSTFNDNKGDPAQNLTQYAAIGGAEISGRIGQGMTQGAGALGNTVAEALKFTQSGNRGNNNGGGGQ